MVLAAIGLGWGGGGSLAHACDSVCGRRGSPNSPKHEVMTWLPNLSNTFPSLIRLGRLAAAGWEAGRRQADISRFCLVG